MSTALPRCARSPGPSAIAPLAAVKIEVLDVLDIQREAVATAEESGVEGIAIPN